MKERKAALRSDSACSVRLRDVAHLVRAPAALSVPGDVLAGACATATPFSPHPRRLAALLPDGAERGSVSALPLAWRAPWPAERADTARRALDRLAAGLAAIEAGTGRRARVGFGPEPGCVERQA